MLTGGNFDRILVIENFGKEMCGRNSVFLSVFDLESRFDAKVTIDDYRLRFEIAVHQLHPVTPNEQPDTITEFRWGLITTGWINPLRSSSMLDQKHLLRSQLSERHGRTGHAWCFQPDSMNGINPMAVQINPTGYIEKTLPCLHWLVSGVNG